MLAGGKSMHSQVFRSTASASLAQEPGACQKEHMPASSVSACLEASLRTASTSAISVYLQSEAVLISSPRQPGSISLSLSPLLIAPWFICVSYVYACFNGLFLSFESDSRHAQDMPRKVTKAVLHLHQSRPGIRARRPPRDVSLVVSASSFLPSLMPLSPSQMPSSRPSDLSCKFPN